jgi:ATP-dependent exoDNAse (exonuclease V) beta subunit
MSSNYTIYNASAGAGKTFTLVKNFLCILLQNDSLESVRSILAITFTNKAANEMKTRILSWLKDFSDEKKYKSNIVLQQISQELDLDIYLLHQRSNKTLSYILHHYSLFSISTIDKFNLRLMKAFTKELGLSYSFAIELDSSNYLKQSIDELVDELGTENPFAEVILNYIFWKFENESSTDIRKELLTSSQNFMKEKNLEQINSLITKDFDDFKKLNQLIIKRVQESYTLIKETAADIITLIESNGLEVGDFYQGARGMAGFFYKIQNPGIILSVNISSSYYKAFCEEKKYAKSKSTKEENIKAIAPQIIDAFYKIKRAIIRIKVDDSVRKNLISIELQSEINRFLHRRKTENDIVFLSDVNPIIGTHLKEEPVAFIYEKLGGRYNHYFIDEFQDTSQLQWNNIVALLDNAKVTEGNSITLVGDPKQAIYRFRSGNPEILMDLIALAEEKGIQVKTLQNNFRSLPNIVDFNNKYYQYLSTYLVNNPEYSSLFGTHAHQISHLQEGGRVQISFISPQEENQLEDKIVEIIEESLQNGFVFKDITILVRNKKHSISIADKIAEKGYPILTEEALLVKSSPEVQSLIYALKWIFNPEDKENLVRMLYLLHRLDRVKFDDFTEEINKIKDFTFDNMVSWFHETLNISLPYQQIYNLSFYDFTEELINSLGFGTKEDLYISALLDLIIQLEKKGVISLQEFLENWELKSPELSIRFPENRNAIQIMTIHKSKGLEFPVVIYPMIESNSNKEEYWFPLEKDLYNGFDKFYSSSKSGLDDTNENIQEVVAIREFENKIDKICIQYVATTRASQQLFLLEEKRDKLSLLGEFLIQQGLLAEGKIELYPMPDFKKKNEKNGKNVIQEEEIQWTSESWNSKIKVSSEVHKFYSEENEEIQYGNSIHSILAEIYTPADLPIAIKKVILSGIIQVDQKEEIEKIIHRVIFNPQLKEYFSEGITAYQEREIIYEGKIYRPDRIIEKQDTLILIDFKTGEKLVGHKKQIELYEQALVAMGKKVKSKILVYISSSNVEVIYV